MVLFIGLAVTLLSIWLGCAGGGRDFTVMWQPVEIFTITGCALGGFFIGNTLPVIKMVGQAIGGVVFRTSNDNFLDLLVMLHAVFKKIKRKGLVAVEQDIENPHSSQLFQQFPAFLRHDAAVTFLCDYLRIVSLGGVSSHDMKEGMDDEIEVFENDRHRSIAAVQALADSLPALGIIAAVLGVINAMHAMSRGPDVLGEMVGSALVGTFFGVTLAYCVCAPLGQAIKALVESEVKYLVCIKTALVGYTAGKDPLTCVELARKSLFTDQRPSFHQLEEKLVEEGGAS